MNAAPPNNWPPAILLLGPTASGKTALAFALAERYPLDIVSVNSAQVFRDMNIGTAKPDAATLARFPHALLDLIIPEERYSAARFRQDALVEMERSTRAKRVPLIVGGTMLYFKALQEGLADLPDADPQLRATIDEAAREKGWPALHAELGEVDPATAARLAPTDAQRIQRALELVRLTGKTLAQLFASQTMKPPPYRFLRLGLMPQERGILHRRIAERFATMLEDGLIEEVEQLRRRYRLAASLPSMRCVGYRQVWQMLEGELARKNLLDAGIFATRQLAKRQLTWMKKMGDIELVDPLASDATDRLLARVKSFMDN